jgi:hypothetical protein
LRQLSKLRLYEYFVDKALETADYDDASAHAPNYLPAGVRRLIASPDFDLLQITSSGDPDAIYAYKFYFNGQEKIPSAWSRWSYPGAVKILNMAFDKGMRVGIVWPFLRMPSTTIPWNSPSIPATSTAVFMNSSRS